MSKHVVVTMTGRTISSQPNIQNVPRPRRDVAGELLAKGLAHIRWKSTAALLYQLGIEVESHDRELVGESRLWGPAWAVYVAEADPCNDQAKEQAIRRALKDESVRAALEALALLTAREDARERFAEVVMEMWTPEEGDQR